MALGKCPLSLSVILLAGVSTRWNPCLLLVAATSLLSPMWWRGHRVPTEPRFWAFRQHFHGRRGWVSCHRSHLLLVSSIWCFLYASPRCRISRLLAGWARRFRTLARILPPMRVRRISFSFYPRRAFPSEMTYAFAFVASRYAATLKFPSGCLRSCPSALQRLNI